MLTVASEPLELRGIASKQSKNGKSYYIVNAETPDGTAHQFYCPDFNALPQGLKKGENIRVYFHVRYFKGNERLEVCKVEKVA